MLFELRVMVLSGLVSWT